MTLRARWRRRAAPERPDPAVLRATHRRRSLLAGAFTTALRGPFALAQGAMPTVRIGVLWDRSGVGAVTSGLDQVVAARLAMDDFGQFSRGYPIEMLDAEFERRPDQAEAIARKWFEQDGVAAIVDIPGTAAPVRVQELARARDRTILNTGSFNAALTGPSCSPTATHWLDDSRSLTMAMTIGLASEGARSWYLIAPDDVTGIAFQTDASEAIEVTGGRLLGVTRYPTEATNFASVLAAARDSGAAAIGLCGFGPSLTAQIKQARALGVFEKSKVCAYLGCIKDVHSLGSREAADLRIVTGFYWNRNERTRSFSRRFYELTRRMPDKPHAATYAAVGQFFRMVEALDTIDGAALNIGLRREPIYFFGANGRVVIDGSVLLDIGLYRVKQSDLAAEPWDYYDLVRSVSASDATRRAPHGACTLTP